MKFLFYSFLFNLVYAAAFSDAKSEASLLEKEAWEHIAVSLAGTKTSSLWDILEDSFDEHPETEEEEGPPSKKIHFEDEPSTSSDLSAPKPHTILSSKIKVAFPINEGSFYDSGLSQEFLPIHEQLPHGKAIYLCGFNCGYQA